MKTQTKDDDQIIATALSNAVKLMKISDDDLAQILSIPLGKVSKVIKDGIPPESDLGELSILVLKIFKKLFSMTGGNHEFMFHFLHSVNRYFKARPIDVMKSKSGMEDVYVYLAGMSEKF